MLLCVIAVTRLADFGIGELFSVFPVLWKIFVMDASLTPEKEPCALCHTNISSSNTRSCPLGVLAVTPRKYRLVHKFLHAYLVFSRLVCNAGILPQPALSGPRWSGTYSLGYFIMCPLGRRCWMLPKWLPGLSTNWTNSFLPNTRILFFLVCITRQKWGAFSLLMLIGLAQKFV